MLASGFLSHAYISTRVPHTNVHIHNTIIQGEKILGSHLCRKLSVGELLKVS